RPPRRWKGRGPGRLCSGRRQCCQNGRGSPGHPRVAARPARRGEEVELRLAPNPCGNAAGGCSPAAPLVSLRRSVALRSAGRALGRSRSDWTSVRPVRILSLDVGDKRIGTATCDELEIVVTPREVIRRDGQEIARIARIIEELG